jgi:hypothetical protein
MADVPNERRGIGNEAGTERRDFIKGAAVAALGAMGLATAVEKKVQAADMPAVDDPQKPAGLAPRAQLDSRFPVTYETSVPEAMRLVTKYFAALSRRDLKAMAETLHFPFGSFEGTEPVVVESAEQLMSSPPPSMNVTGNGDHLIKPGTYDMLDSIQLHVYNPVGAGLSLTYSRYDTTGHKLLTCEGVYGVTNNDGKWGIELMSTIFKPADQLGLVPQDGVEATLRQFNDWCLFLAHGDPALRDSARQLGRQAFLMIGDPLAMAHSARLGEPMDVYRIKGVKSRLRVSEVKPETLANFNFDVPKFADEAGGGVGKWGSSLAVPSWRALHATVDKSHTFEGYIRYTTDNTVIDETQFLGIVTYRGGKWGMSGMIGEIMYHDRSNDVRS